MAGSCESADQPSGGTPDRPLYKPELPVAEIPFAEFAAAKKDRKVAEFLEAAKAENEQLEREGKIHF